MTRSAWRGAGHLVELHIYAQGGHGFEMKKQGLPSDHWIDRFADWLQSGLANGCSIPDEPPEH